MSAFSGKVNLRIFSLNVVLPTLLTVGLFVALIFGYIIPAFERNMLSSKKEMLRELVTSANGIADRFYRDAQAGLLSEAEAKAAAMSRIGHLRYGVNNKDYFWITDMHPVMIMHPYRPDLNGGDLTEYRDPTGKALFVEMVQQIRRSGEGYVDYEWQWMDDSLSVVPKISYVRAFAPWGWVIGTGVYIEDVKNEIAAIKTRLTLVSLAITACMAFLLVLIARNNLKLEIKRNEAERELHISREKYKALVEASTEGTAMVLGNRCIFSNEKFQDLFGVGQSDAVTPDLSGLIGTGRSDDLESIRRFAAGPETFMQIETSLRTTGGSAMSALLSLSKVTLGGEGGLIIVVKELSRDDSSEAERSERGRQLLALADASEIGIFKCTIGRGAKLLDVNDGMVKMLGYESKESLLEVDLSEVVDEDSDLRAFIKMIAAGQFAREVALQMRHRSGRAMQVAVTALAERDSAGIPTAVYGTMVDISRQREQETQVQQLHAELQGQLLFMDQQVKRWTREVVSCELQAKISDVARLMTGFESDVVLVRAATGEHVGMMTDADIRQRVIGAGVSADRPVSEFMTAPLHSVGEHETLAQAVNLMREKGVEHLCVRDARDRICGTIRKGDVVNLQHSTSAVLAAAVRESATVAELRLIYRRLPLYVGALSESGARTAVITSAITGTSDAIRRKLEEFVIRELGAPPAPYAFVALGSEGRCEQTLLTDQDNAIIYEDVAEGRRPAVEEYFANYGARMCRLLHETGFNYCAGEIMASNPRWNKPLSEWRRYYAGWVREPDPQALLESAIFFDFRAVCGDAALVAELGRHVRQLLKDNPSFLPHLAREGINYKTPLGLFGKIQTDAGDGHSPTLNLKSPLRVIVNLVRLYAMKHGLEETNTIGRIHGLRQANVFSSSFYRDLLYSYDYLMALQLRTQARALRHGASVTNAIDLPGLSAIELNTLKNVLSQLGTFQSKTRYDFGVSE